VRAATVIVAGPTPAPGPEPSASAGQPSVTLALDAGHVVITGTVPSEKARAALVVAATDALGAGSVEDHLTVDPRLGDAGLAGLGAVLKALGPDARNAVVELRAGTITLSGTVPSQAAHDAAVQAATEAVGTPSAVVDRLVIVTPQPSTPATPTAPEV